MNILILQTKAFPQRTNSFYWFYSQLSEWLTQNGVKSELHFCYIEAPEGEFENGLLLPDYYLQFYTPGNIEATCRYIDQQKIDVILDYSHTIVGDMKRYYQEIKRRHPALKVFTMIHSCPNHTAKLLTYKLSVLRLKDAHGAKQLFQWMFPKLYLWLLKQLVTYQNRSAYHTLDEVVLLSPAYIPEFRKLIKEKKADRLSAIPNAIRPVVSNVPIEEKKKEIIFAGRLTPEKAIEKLLKIWEMIQDKLPEWQLTIVGDGPSLPFLKEVVSKKNLKRVNFTGYQMAIPYIDHARIICLTSVIEGLPTVFTEAMALGVVPVGFASFNAIHDMIENGKNGFIIPEDDYQGYADLLLRLAEDDAMRCKVAATARSQTNRYSIEYIGPLWLEAFKKHKLID